MEANKILQSSFLDLLFEGRNKLYGAYDLRRTYNSRIIKALLFTATFLFTCVLLSSFANKNKILDKPEFIDTFLGHIPPEILAPEVKVILPVAKKTIAVAAVQQKFTTPKIVIDDIVKPEEKVETLKESLAIGTENIKIGKSVKIVVAPTSDTGTTVAKIVIGEKDPGIFLIVEKEAEFPGGNSAWRKFLQNNLDANRPVTEGAAPGRYTVLVQFVVSVDGTVSDVKALTSAGFGMEKEAVKVISNGPKWKPAFQNGRNVNAYRKQPVTFLVQED